MSAKNGAAEFLESYLREYEKDADFVAEGMALSVAEQALKIMREKGVTHVALAASMGVAPSFVSRVFNARPNLTLRSIARMAIALGVQPVCVLAPRENRAFPSTHVLDSETEQPQSLYDSSWSLWLKSLAATKQSEQTAKDLKRSPFFRPEEGLSTTSESRGKTDAEAPRTMKEPSAEPLAA